jgi:hypothetical protein
VSLSSLPPSGGHPARLPERFVDRSLGRVQVPRILRAAGLRLMTLAERYGRPADESVTDVEWLEEAGRRDWVVMRANAQRFLANLAAMERACAEPGPFIYAVHERQLERLNLG